MRQQTLLGKFQKLTTERGGPSTGAEFSPCRQYRYALWRHWEWTSHANCVMFIGLNPSTADEQTNDQTIKKCIGFAKRWGYGGIYMLNLFAWISTIPEGMYLRPDPIGPGNDEAFAYYRTRVGLVVAAWGGSVPNQWRAKLKWHERIKQVSDAIGRPLYCLGRTNDGSPRHPSRVAYSRTPREIWEGEGCAHRCAGCGCEIHPFEMYCGECFCEEDCVP